MLENALSMFGHGSVLSLGKGFVAFNKRASLQTRWLISPWSSQSFATSQGLCLCPCYPKSNTSLASSVWKQKIHSHPGRTIWAKCYTAACIDSIVWCVSYPITQCGTHYICSIMSWSDNRHFFLSLFFPSVITSCDNVQLYMSHQVKWESVRILWECVQIARF